MANWSCATLGITSLQGLLAGFVLLLSLGNLKQEFARGFPLVPSVYSPAEALDI